MAEEHVLVRMEIADELRKHGFNVAEAANAYEAVSILHSGVTIDLVIADIKMQAPQDDAGLAAIIRTEYPEVKMVVTSAQVMEDQLDWVVDGFVRKPYDAPEVAVYIKALLDQQ